MKNWKGFRFIQCISFICLCTFVARAQTPQTGSASTSSAARNAESPESSPLHDAANIIKAAAAKPAPIRLLVIGAHPADVFDQAGGTMAHHIARGDWVGCVAVTTGVRVHDKVVVNQLKERGENPDAAQTEAIIAERARVKQGEVIKACGILGVRAENVHFLGVDDGVLLVNEKVILQIASLIRQLRPDVIITHYPFEDAGISVHSVAAQMVLRAIESAAGPDPGDKNPAHKVAQVFFFGQGAATVRYHLWSAQGGFYNDVFVDITDVIEKKHAAINAMESQNYSGNYARRRMEVVDGAFGIAGVPYAEGFISLRSSVHYYLPVSPIDLEHAKSSDESYIGRRSFRVPVP